MLRLNSGKPKGHLLLCHDVGVHAENRERIKISAGLAFEQVYPLEIRRLADGNAPKSAKINNAFYQVAQHVSDTYLWPFLWLEPDCTPTCQDWMDKLWAQYANQPRAFFGNRMQYQLKDKDPQQFMARVGIYPQNAITILPRIEAANPFELVSGKVVAPKLTPTKLIHQLAIKGAEDAAKVRPEALIVHGDKNQILLNSVTVNPKEIDSKLIVKSVSAPLVMPVSIEEAPFKAEGTAVIHTTAKLKPVGSNLPPDNAPRQTRRQKAEALDKQHRDLVATNGARSSTQVV
jgi:hypothetical protein